MKLISFEFISPVVDSHNWLADLQWLINLMDIENSEDLMEIAALDRKTAHNILHNYNNPEISSYRAKEYVCLILQAWGSQEEAISDLVIENDDDLDRFYHLWTNYFNS
jgi:hypothetical protein